ncbi:DUF6998 domain-containing protein [Tenacibaculum aquimarinum]|uniref:DUF6998 domain-containing protein n=1 Tax=Tenacibaculum aquimarinum TaxID=2910675 RepID=UPI001F0A6D40|nr:hypothetical protein [Tenacibaculum aquimarinum]MCH3881705.1 hypothetical protein [Tenacibaculum aquimarinum]
MKEIKELLAITKRLREKYKLQKKNFTLDGKLVGDIGEVLVSEKYGIELYSDNFITHDGFEIATDRKVQIKASFHGYSYFPDFPIPDYFISVNILENGELEELFNGPGQFIVDEYIVKRGLKKQKEYTLSKNILKDLSEKVPLKDKRNRVNKKAIRNESKRTTNK